MQSKLITAALQILKASRMSASMGAKITTTRHQLLQTEGI